MGDVKCLEDSIHNSGNVCGRASMEEEAAIPGHYDILKVDGGRIDCIVLKVCEQNVDACGTRCQEHTNIFSGSEVFEGLNDALETQRMAAKGVIIDDGHIVEVDSRPYVVYVDGNFRQQHKALSDERKISTWSAKGFPNCIVGSPYLLNDRWRKGVRTKK